MDTKKEDGLGYRPRDKETKLTRLPDRPEFNMPGAKAKRHPLIRILAIILLGLFLSAGILAYRYYRFASDSRATSISDPA
ncbi:MAG TPA: hypothetical protein VFT53_04800, partial [Candidatus Saccharimonadales bacterium]|nr:hypothetical protein [Candidatus Saccharimonadales bacterium]